MTVEQMTILGFKIEILSTKVNLWNDRPFVFNGIETIIQYKNQYCLSVDCRSLDEMLSSIRSLEVL